MIDDKDISKLVDVKTAYTNTQQVIVNNQQAVVHTKHTVACCPTCNTILLDFGDVISMQDAENIIKMNRQQLESNYGRCPNCRQKIDYDFYILDAEVVEEKIQA